MNKVLSKQQNVKFSFCPSPVTIDKSKDWGEGNMQHFPNGVFLKHNDDGSISHGVQPNEDKSAPIGWVKQANGLYQKNPIWVLEKLNAGQKRKVTTLDGSIDYDIQEESFLVCQDKNGEQDLNDSWVIKAKDLIKSYHLEGEMLF